MIRVGTQNALLCRQHWSSNAQVHNMCKVSRMSIDMLAVQARSAAQAEGRAQHGDGAESSRTHQAAAWLGALGSSRRSAGDRPRAAAEEQVLL